MRDRFSRALERGAADREAGKTLRDNPYKLRLHRNHWEHAWTQKDGELTMTDFTNVNNPFSPLSYKNTLFR